MITVTGLGPGDLDRLPAFVKDLLLDAGRTVIVRTVHHPASEQLATMREVVFCDDLYESTSSFEDTYAAIVHRVLEHAERGPVVYAVPGSPMIGEFAARSILEAGVEAEVITAESFIDAILAEMAYDPLSRGIQVLNGHELPSPLVLDKPTIFAHLDRPEVLADVCASIDRVLPDGEKVTVLANLGSSGQQVIEQLPHEVSPSLAGYRTSLFIDSAPGGLVGAVQTMRRLRAECPWDRDQTHQSLVKNLVEESFELIDAISKLDEEDLVSYASVEDELGDVLLQVLFHGVIARERGVFDIDDVAETMRQKLVRRHPHVFGEVEAGSASEVKENWDRIKAEERGNGGDRSALDDVAVGMPALGRATKIQNRAAKVGFDWSDASQVMPKLAEELSELEAALGGSGNPQSELGDLLFSAVNLARHLGLDPELALRAATDRFERRFRRMEQEGPLDDLDLSALDERWERAKLAEEPSG